MITFRQWLVLLVLYTAFMLAGAVMFLYLELGHEYFERESLSALKYHVTEVVGSLGNGTRDRVEVLLWEIGEECGHDFLTLEEDAPLKWTLWNSFFFTFTVITTIGFGHMAPKTPWGRIACILYAFIGVPFNGIVMVALADIFSHKVINWDVRQWAARYKSWVTVLVDTIVFLVPGLVVFLVLPSLVLMYVEEDWTYLDSFYFSFITLTTIGFGDSVAGQQERGQLWVWVYKVVMVVWIIFGLGYIIMIITFVQKALKSKKILRVEKRMKSALKKHVSRVHRDLGAIRRAINSSSSTGGTKTKPKPPSTVPSVRRTRPRTPKTSFKAKPTPPTPPAPAPHRLTPFSRPRSASESDLSLPYMTRRRELEGMNAMLDFIERLLHHQENQAISNFSNILEQNSLERDDGDEEEEDEEGKEGSEDVEDGGEAGRVNEAYEIGDDEEADDWLFPERLGSHVEELLYLMVIGRGRERFLLPDFTHTPIASRHPTILTSSTANNPNLLTLTQGSRHSPPPSYSSLNPRLLSKLSLSASPHHTLTYSPYHSRSQSPYQTIPPSPQQTLTLLSQIFSSRGGNSGAASPFAPSTPLPRSPNRLSPAPIRPSLSLPPHNAPNQPSTQSEEGALGEVTKF